MKLPIDAVKEIDNTTWRVQSSDGAQYYTITWDHHKCPINCHLICIDCNIYVHCYTCNCPDALIQSTICKHIHLVVRYQHSHSPSPPQDAIIPDASKTDATVLLRSLQSETNDKILHIKNRMYKRLCVLGAMVTQCYNSESLLAAEKLLNSAKCAIKAINRTAPFVQVQPHEPSNKNIVRQRSFYSTKKEKKSTC